MGISPRSTEQGSTTKIGVKARRCSCFTAFFGTAARWDAYVDDLATQYRVIAWDMRGHGRSSNPNASDVFLHEDAAHDLLALMDHLEIPHAKAVGASSGAMLLLHAATQNPDRFDALVLVGGFAYRNVAARSRTEQAAFLDEPSTVEGLKRDHGETKLPVLSRQFRRLATLYGDMAFTPDMLATISAPTLIVQGDNDGYVTPSQGVEVFEAIPRSRLWIMPNGGHLVHMVPANRDDFLRRVAEFLADNGRSARGSAAQRGVSGLLRQEL